jgi:hypothetical protein
MTEKQIIKIIKDYNNLCKNINTLFNDAREEHQECENKTIDYYHTLELEKLDYHQRAKLTTQQQKNLIKRRKCKDYIEFLTPLKKWLGNGQTTHTNNQLTQALREMERVVNKRDGRKYQKRSKEE